MAALFACAAASSAQVAPRFRYRHRPTTKLGAVSPSVYGANYGPLSAILSTSRLAREAGITHCASVRQLGRPQRHQPFEIDML